MNTTLLEPTPLQTPAPPPPVAAPPGALKRMSFGAAKKTKDEGKTAYPVFVDPNGQVAIIAARIKQRTEEFDALEGAIKTDKAELKMLVAPFYFTHNKGKHEVPSSISVQFPQSDPSGRALAPGEVLVTFQNRYTKLKFEEGKDPVAPIAAVLGAKMDDWFKATFSIKIDGGLLPEAQSQEIVNEIIAVLTKHNAMEAMQVDEELKPVKSFHAARHLDLTPEQNLALEQACPIIAMVKTKRRGDSK